MQTWQKWEVYIGRKWVDTVFFVVGMSAREVRESLIGHDGYAANIRVNKA